MHIRPFRAIDGDTFSARKARRFRHFPKSPIFLDSDGSLQFLFSTEIVFKEMLYGHLFLTRFVETNSASLPRQR